MELSEFNIEYALKNSVKWKVLENFVIEFTSFPERVLYAPPMKFWQVLVNGSSCVAGGGVRVHIVTNVGEEHD